MATPTDTQAVWAELMIDALASSGVGHVVLSPGSRSTPLVVALDAEPRLCVHDVVDERSAAFVALGIARATGVPAALVCTSGSAVAHYHPAVAEAAASSLPLVVLSANRPFAFQRAGESQTIDQTKLFGDAVRFFADLGEPSPRAFDLRAMRRVVAQAVSVARGPNPGPVHLDARFVKPLEPPLVPDATHSALAAEIRARGVARIHPARSTATDEAIDRLVSTFATARRPIVVVGPRRTADLGDGLAELADVFGVPVFVDPTSNHRFGARPGLYLGATDAIFRSPRVLGDSAPDLVLQIGRAPVASGYAKLCTERAPASIAIDAHDYLDPWSLASDVVLGDAPDTLARLVRRLRETGVALDPEWATGLRALDAFAFEEAARLARAGGLTEGGIARALVAALPDGGRLVLGNSLAVREVDDYVPPSEKRVHVLSQRGASGIDGLVAGLVGAQLASPAPSALLIGDVSLSHDLGSLTLLRRVSSPTVVLVVDNGGGRIFEQLPIATRMPAAMSHFATPPEVDFASVARSLGLRAVSVDSDASLRASLDDAVSVPSATLVHVRVSEHGADEQNRALFRAVDEAAPGRR